MATTTCTNCGRPHEIDERVDYVGDEDSAYVMYTCDDNGTTYGRTVPVTAIEGDE